jgi:TolB-like protein/tetratricopeptide (TPR) repeat protein
MNRQGTISGQQSVPGIDPNTVKNQLERILRSDEFADTPRLQEFLSYVVDETLQGREDRIKGFTIAHDVFHRDDPDDAQSTPIVRVEAGRLRRRLDDYYQGEGQRDPLRIQIPKGGYVPRFDRVATETEQAPPGRPAPDPGHRSRPDGTQWAIFGVVAAVALLAAMFLWPGSPPATPDVFTGKPAIAILPFEDMTTDQSGVTMANGLTEDIITDLSRVSSIDVIAWSSVRLFGEKTVSDDEIGSALNVSHVLRGSIRGAEEQLRVTAQLFEVKTGRQIWAERFDRTPGNELALQDALALKVVEGMSVRLREDQSILSGNTRIMNSEAYSLYKQALNLANPPADPRRLRVANRAFHEVIKTAPDFAGGYAGVAYTHAFLAWWGHSENPEEDIEKALTFADQALALDPDFGIAHSAVAFAHMTHRDFEQALAASLNAIRAEPNDPYVSSYHGFIVCANGQAEEGIPFAQRAIRLDPVFPRTPFRNILGIIYFHAGQYQEALDAFQRNLDLGGPRSPGLLAYQAATYATLGRTEEARATLDLVNMYGDNFDWEGWLRRAFREEHEVERVLRPLRELDKEQGGKK